MPSILRCFFIFVGLYKLVINGKIALYMGTFSFLKNRRASVKHNIDVIG